MPKFWLKLLKYAPFALFGIAMYFYYKDDMGAAVWNIALATFTLNLLIADKILWSKKNENNTRSNN